MSPRVSDHPLWQTLRPHRRSAIRALTAVLLATGVGLTTPYLVKVAIDDGVVKGDTAVLNTVLIVYLGLIGLRFAANRVHVLTVAVTGQRALRDIRVALFQRLQHLSAYDEESAGKRVARTTNDVDALSSALTEGVTALITSVTTLAGIGVIMAVLDWRLAIATLAVVPILVWLARWHRARSAPAWRAVREAETVVTSTAQETLATVRVIQTFRHEDQARQRFRTALDGENQAERRTVRISSVFFPAVELSGAVASVIVLLAGGYWVLRGEIGIGVLVAFLMYVRSLFGPIMGLSEVYDTFQAASVGTERIRATMALRPTVPEPECPTPLPSAPCGIELDGVSFRYPGERPPVLHGIELRVLAGTALALVGPTGAGKSTIAKLMLRLYDPQHGRVRIGGVDVRDITGEELRRAIGYVPQETLLFPGSIADNIRYGRPDATDGDVLAVLDALGATGLVDRLPDGLATEVGERGARLASGQRQLVAVARAWLRDPRILILDEATSSLDEPHETAVREAIGNLHRRCTTITIVHRLATALDADLVAVVHKGRIVEQGPPNDLLSRDSLFRTMFDVRPST